MSDWGLLPEKPVRKPPPPMKPGRRLSSVEVAELKQKIEDLLAEYNASIGGCGCCGSPALSWVNEEGLFAFDEGYNPGYSRKEVPL